MSDIYNTLDPDTTQNDTARASNNTISEPTYLDRKAAQAYLAERGIIVSYQWFIRYRGKLIPKNKIANKIFYLKSDIDKFLLHSKMGSSSDE